jgi:hypothetical protein
VGRDAVEKVKFRRGAINDFPTTRRLENSLQKYKEIWSETKIKF